MIDADELEIAQEELRWLLSGCNEFIQAHRLLGDLALWQSNDEVTMVVLISSG